MLVGEDKEGNLFYQMFLDYDREKARKKRNSADNQDRLSLNNIITDIQEDFNPYMKKHEVHNNKENTEMTLIDELKKLITKVENNKEQEMTEKIENEKADKRKLIDEIGGILKGKVDEEEVLDKAVRPRLCEPDLSAAGKKKDKRKKKKQPSP